MFRQTHKDPSSTVFIVHRRYSQLYELQFTNKLEIPNFVFFSGVRLHCIRVYLAMLVCPKHIQIFLESADWRTGAKTTEVETRVATCVWFASTDHSWNTAHRQYKING